MIRARLILEINYNDNDYNQLMHN